MFNKERIEKRLTKTFLMVSTITALAAVIGIITMMVLVVQYSNALENYGFAQGDIGKAMFEFADTRSALRGTIGYEDQDAINVMQKQHQENKVLFQKSFEEIEKTIVSKDGRTTYDEIKKELDSYWTLDNKVMETGATEDQELCRKAQDMAINQLGPMYENIYSKLEELLNVKVTEGDKLSKRLNIISMILAAMIAMVLVISMLISVRMGKSIARGIARPLKELGKRFATFATGDLSSAFPTTNADDEVSDMIKQASDMAENLNVIINDAGELLGKMAEGNYAIKTQIPDRYTGDFSRLLEAMRNMREQMTTTLEAISEASEQVAAGSNHIADAGQALAEGSTEQASAVQELHASIVNIAETAEKSMQNAEDSYQQARHYADDAEKSRHQMEAMLVAMERINQTSNKIGNIISEIESIASQTNLLSLNASIEAARAGDAGRGFAVVADQIRDLADQSAKAAISTRELIEGSLQEIAEGSQAAQQASTSILSVVEGMKCIAETSKELSLMAETQAEAMREAEKGVNQISGVVQNNAATAQESSATSEELSAQTIALNEHISKFILE
ncbi:MAG: HAMP domain-containing protein [Lachnospiraceae bacterium]|nr:HAMP domain-containing protein [Lachnospiraceae bacterium]